LIRIFSILFLSPRKETKEAHLSGKSLTRLLALLPSRVAFKDAGEMNLINNAPEIYLEPNRWQ